MTGFSAGIQSYVKDLASRVLIFNPKFTFEIKSKYCFIYRNIICV